MGLMRPASAAVLARQTALCKNLDREIEATKHNN